MYQKYLKICIVISVFLSSVSAQVDPNIVTLQQGTVQGMLNHMHNYRTFYGIPYASVIRRFEDPGEPPIWNGTLKADRRTILCKQFDSTTKSIVGVEDCLTLNIYTPANITKPLPVIVFMFGGGLFKGSNTDDRYNARYLVQKMVIVVTINYRIGAFGFLCLRKKGAPGNAGLKDKVAALRWINNNIAAFGGDPNSVTLNGESVGGNAISIFILTQVAKGLFKRAILNSGNAIRPLYFDRDPINTAAKVANRLGHNTTNPDELLEIFKTASADDIVRAYTNNAPNNVFARFVFATCIEDVNVSENAILKENPRDLLQLANNISDISIIMGYDNKEGITWSSDYYNSEGLRLLDSDFSIVIPKNIMFKKDEYKSKFTEEVRNIYFGNSSTTYSGLINYFSDALVHFPSVFVIEALVSNPRISLYNYFFKYSSNRNKYKLAFPFASMPGASHCDELYYIYDPVEYRNSTPTPKDAMMIDVMTDLWTNFAKTGIPFSTGRNFKWIKSEKPLNFLTIDDEIKMTSLPNQKRIDFWRSSQEKYGLFYL